MAAKPLSPRSLRVPGLQAEKRGVPRVENTTVDRSVGLIHMTLLG